MLLQQVSNELSAASTNWISCLPNLSGGVARGKHDVRSSLWPVRPSTLLYCSTAQATKATTAIPAIRNKLTVSASSSFSRRENSSLPHRLMLPANFLRADIGQWRQSLSARKGGRLVSTARRGRNEAPLLLPQRPRWRRRRGGGGGARIGELQRLERVDQA
jgi:hypothetical protein